MPRRGTSGDKYLALFFLGVLLLSPHVLSLFSRDALVLGVPLLYLYLFLAWSLLVLLMALTSETRRRFRGGRARFAKGSET